MSEFKRASWSRRFIAYVIDNVIVEMFWIVLIAGLVVFTPVDISDIFDIIVEPETSATTKFVFFEKYIYPADKCYRSRFPF